MELVKRDLIALINDFEELLDAYTGIMGFCRDYIPTKIVAIGITFVPCAIELKCTNARVYLG